MFFVSCSDDNDEGSGINGTYATSGEYDNYTGKTFREMIVITKSSFTTYSTQAVQDKSYWGAGAFQVPGAKGWYVGKAHNESTHMLEPTTELSWTTEASTL